MPVHFIPAGLLVMAALTNIADAAAATQPVVPRADLLARADPTPVLKLWPNDPPAVAPFDEGVELRPRDNDPEHRVIDVWAVKDPSLAVYPAKSAGGPMAAVIVCPGGGYRMESYTYEGSDIAKRLNARGVTAFVLRYRLPDGKAPPAGQLPVPQQDVLRAVQIVRERAAEFGIDPAKVGVLGFSAGGHLAATAATLFDQAPTLADMAGHDAASAVSARPDFTVLAYPVVSMGTVTHAGSRQCLIGKTADKALQERFSAELHVTANTPPMFIFHAEDDGAVPVANSLLLATAAAKAHVPVELLLFSKGGHGFGLAKPGDEAAVWFDRMFSWMQGRGIVPTGG